MSDALCFKLAAIIIACMGVPDTTKRVTVPRHCAAQLSKDQKTKGIACAAAHGIAWRFERRQRR